MMRAYRRARVVVTEILAPMVDQVGWHSSRWTLGDVTWEGPWLCKELCSLDDYFSDGSGPMAPATYPHRAHSVK